MAVKLKGLGRGLDALLMPEPTKVDAPAAGVTSLKVGEMIAGKYQPRRFDDASFAELSASIKAQGIMQPIVVSKTGASGAANTKSSPVSAVSARRNWRVSPKCR